MPNKVYITKQGFIEIEVIGDQTEQSVQQMGREVATLIIELRRRSQPVLILDNLKELGETTPEARREVARLAQTLDFDQAAMVGSSAAMMRYGTNLMLRAIGRSNVRFFASRDAALLWLGIELD